MTLIQREVIAQLTLSPLPLSGNPVLSCAVWGSVLFSFYSASSFCSVCTDVPSLFILKYWSSLRIDAFILILHKNL